MVYTKVPSVITKRHAACTAPAVLGHRQKAPQPPKTYFFPKMPPTAAPDGKGCAGFKIHRFFTCHKPFAHRISRHRKHRATRQKIDGGHACKPRRIQHRLNNYAAADAADSPHARRKKRNQQINKIQNSTSYKNKSTTAVYRKTVSPFCDKTTVVSITV